MAYVAGTAASFADLLAGLQAACVANGWTLTGNVLHKGSCYVEALTVSQSFPCLRTQGGTGVASGVLTGRSSVHAVQIGMVATLDVSAGTIPLDVPFTFPMDYEVHIHADPDEVYFIVNYSTRFYQLLAFGQTAQPGLGGTGNWYAGTDIESNRAAIQAYISATGTHMDSAAACGGIFQQVSTASAAASNGAVDHSLDGASWLCEGAWRDWYSLHANSPSAWNAESVLLPIRVYASRPSGFVSIVAEMAHARYVNIQALQDQQIITLGSDRWKVYPWWSRGTTYNSGGFSGTFSGLGGHAIRYDGP